MADIGYIQTFKADDPLRKVANVQDHNRQANIWNNIQGIGCRIVKGTNAEGKDWKIICGDGSSDIDTTELDPDFTPPDYKPIRDLEEQLDTRGINKTFYALSDSASYDEILDGEVDYRGRHIECWIKKEISTDNESPVIGEEWLAGTISADVDIVAEPTYTVYVSSTDGSLNIKATAVETEYIIVWIRASDKLIPSDCPCTDWLPSSWPCEDLVEEYTVSNGIESPYDSDMIHYRSEIYSNSDCTGTLNSWSEVKFASDVTVIANASRSCYWLSSGVVQYYTRTNGSAWSIGQSDTVTIELINGEWEVKSVNPTNSIAYKKTGLTPVGEVQNDSCNGANQHKYNGFIVEEAT